MCVDCAVNCCVWLLKLLQSVLSVLRNDLKSYETAGSGGGWAGGKGVKIDVDSGVSRAVVGRVPVLVSSASRAKHICDNLRFGECGSSSLFSVPETEAS